MKKLLIFFCVGLTTLLFACTSTPYKMDKQATADAPWQEGEVLAVNTVGFDSEEQQGYRRFVGVTSEGYFLVQDFFGTPTEKSASLSARQDEVKFTDIYQIGAKEELGKISQNGIEGLRVMYYMNGQVRAKGELVHGTPQGKWELWYKGGQKMEVGYYDLGQRHGRWQGWREDGSNNFDVNFKHDEQHGTWKHWYENGNLKSEVEWADGARTFTKQWHKNGQLQQKGYHTGEFCERTGIWRWWDEKGNLIKEEDFGAEPRLQGQ